MKKSNSGQVLLITIMLLATILTIVMAVSFKSTTETQTTKLQEESQKALAAAEAGIEKALKEGSSFDPSTLDLGEGITASVMVAPTVGSNEHISRTLNKDEQYTLYLGNVTGDPPDFSTLTPVYSGGLNICFKSSAVEITIITDNADPLYAIKKYAINPAGTTIISNASSASTPGQNECPPGTDFDSIYPLAISPGSKLLIARIVTTDSSASTKLGFRGTSATNLPVQGKTLISTGTTSSGASKKVQLFQSYPQIPAEFFVTSL